VGTKHLLASKICLFKEKKVLGAPEDCKYDNVSGVWLWGDENKVLVKSDNSKRPKVCSKKEDIETGEDLKGE
jgi:hypothetical protein